MKIYIDEAFNCCVGRSLRVSRGDLLALEVVLPASAGAFLEVRFGGKVSHDGEFLVYSYATGVSGEFTLQLNLNTDELKLALKDDDCLVVPCELEFRREGEVQTVRGIKLKVDQDIIKGSEVAPSEIPGVLSISPDGYFIVNGIKTTFIAEPKITIGENGNWFVNGVDQGRRAIPDDPHFPLFAMIYSDHVMDDPCWVVSEGQWLDGDAYADAYALLLDQFNAGVAKTVDGIAYREGANKMRIAGLNQSALIDALYSSRGDGWFYCLDALNKRFRLPRTKNFLRVGESVGDYKQDQIVNISGTSMSNSFFYGSGSPVGKKSGPYKVTWAQQYQMFNTSQDPQTWIVSIDFDASQQVKTGDQVQPRSTSVLLCFRVANRYA